MAIIIYTTGCTSPFDRIDRNVDALIAEASGEIGEFHPPAYASPEVVTAGPFGSRRSWRQEQPGTINPTTDALAFVRETQQEAEAVIDRLQAYADVPDDAMGMDLASALAFAAEHAREFTFAEEEYILAALRLLIQRHQWGPRFFDDVSATARGTATDGTYDTSLALVNEFRVTQRLPYGGEVSARALATATEDLHQRVAGEAVSTASMIIEADVPLLRGAGQAARESRIQAERNLIYAARTFGRFRREFLFGIASDYLGLIVRLRQIENARLGVESFESLQEQQEALYRAGRSTPFDTAEAENETLEAVDRLNTAAEQYRLALDRFKLRIGMPVSQPLIIDIDSLNLPTPRTQLEAAVEAGLTYRLDLQNSRDQVVDAERSVENAENAALADLRGRASFTLPTDPDVRRPGGTLDPDGASFEAGVTLGLPLDREVERIGIRTAQIGLVRARRAYERARDDVAITARAAVRGIDSALFSLRIQERNVQIAERRQASIEADPARANIRQKTDAINQVFSARDARDAARRDLEVAVLGYLLQTGQLRVAGDGTIDPLPGMELTEDPDESDRPGGA